MKKPRKFFELRNGLKAIDYRNKDYFDRIDDKERSLYSPYMIMRYASSVTGDKFYQEHYVEMVNECVNKNLFLLSGKHKTTRTFSTGKRIRSGNIGQDNHRQRT